MVTTAFRLCSQLEEIRVATSIVHKVSGFRDQFFGDETIFAQGKMSQLFQSCRDLIQQKNASVRTVSQIIGKLTSSVKAVLPAPLQWARGTKLCFP